MEEKGKEVDFIIVGQGLAGTLLSYFLRKQNQKILVLDKEYPRSATSVAAGIINPITGRRFVKSWMIDTLVPFAENTYTDLEQLLGGTFYHRRNILRTLFNNREENDWLGRTSDESYGKYALGKASLGFYESKIEPVFSYCEMHQTAQVSVGDLAMAYRAHLRGMDLYRQEDFDCSQIKFLGDKVSYKGMLAKKIIFCEGNLGEQNPYFDYLPFWGAKGESLLVKIPDTNFQKMFKHRIFIVPLGGELYWCGATNQNDPSDDIPTAAARTFIENRLKDILNVPFEIIEHRSAIRPTIKDRRPLIGTHPKHSQLFIFNGLGTKGASLGPYWANETVAHLMEDKALDKEVDIRRFT